MAASEATGTECKRPGGLWLGTNLSGLIGLLAVWAGGFGCIGSVHNHLSEDRVPGQPALQLFFSLCLIAFGMAFLLVSYGLDRGRPWSRHLVLAGGLAALCLVAFGWGRPDALQQKALLWTAGFTLLATGYFYAKPNVVAYYRYGAATNSPEVGRLPRARS